MMMCIKYLKVLVGKSSLELPKMAFIATCTIHAGRNGRLVIVNELPQTVSLVTCLCKNAQVLAAVFVKV